MSDKGGSAFPHEAGRTNTGMTLRDYFAAKAMQGMLAYSSESGDWGNVKAYYVAAGAYAIADAMLAERAK